MKTPFQVTPKQAESARFAAILSRVLGEQIYAGTVPAKTKAKRRAANRAARTSRQTTRRAA